MFGGLGLVEPGLVDATRWHPEDTVGPEHTGSWAGIARVGGSPTGNGGGS
jgi:hypothetical protein